MISIITPSYNSEKFISETIDSVLAQTYQNWEMIIVDDVSTDNSIGVISKYLVLDNRIKLIQLNKNSGAAVARNTAIKIAKGRYIAFLDSDDLWTHEKLEKHILFMQLNNYPFTFSSYEKISEDGVNNLGIVSTPKKVNYQELLKTNVIGCLTAIYDTKYFGKVLMPLIRKRQDFGLWLKLLKRTDYAYSINEPLAIYRVRTGSISSNKLNTISSIWGLYRDIEQLSILSASYYFLNYAFNGIYRRKLFQIKSSDS